MDPGTVVRVELDSGLCYAVVLPTEGRTPPTDIRVSIAGIAHLAPLEKVHATSLRAATRGEELR